MMLVLPGSTASAGTNTAMKSWASGCLTPLHETSTHSPLRCKVVIFTCSLMPACRLCCRAASLYSSRGLCSSLLDGSILEMDAA